MRPLYIHSGFLKGALLILQYICVVFSYFVTDLAICILYGYSLILLEDTRQELSSCGSDLFIICELGGCNSEQNTPTEPIESVLIQYCIIYIIIGDADIT